MTHPADPSIPKSEDIARTQRQLRLMKALLELDDPEMERALTAILERLIAAREGSDDPSSPRSPALKTIG